MTRVEKEAHSQQGRTSVEREQGKRHERAPDRGHGLVNLARIGAMGIVGMNCPGEACLLSEENVQRSTFPCSALYTKNDGSVLMCLIVKNEKHCKLYIFQSLRLTLESKSNNISVLILAFRLAIIAL
jgi:hypothetical protein